MELAFFFKRLLFIHEGSLRLILLFKRILNDWELNKGSNGGVTGSTACAMVFAYFQHYDRIKDAFTGKWADAQNFIRFFFFFVPQFENWGRMVIDLADGHDV
jgi:DNA polymerase sigma